MAEALNQPNASARAFLADWASVFPELREPTFLARGGQGQVFRAQGPDPFDPSRQLELAVKVFGLEGEPRPEDERRIEAELDTAARLHTLIARSDDPRRHQLLRFARVLRSRWKNRAVVGLLAPFFPEGTLAAWRAGLPRDDAQDPQGCLALEQLLVLVEDLCRGLGFLHAHGYVHRDCKPSNVFLQRDEQGRLRAVLGDFGCTRLEGQSTRMVSLDFAPTDPREDSGPAWDVCSLGFLLAWLLRGHLEPPFRERGRLSAAVLTRARGRELVQGVDARWYEGLTGLLLAATHNDFSKRPDVDELWERLSRLTRRARARVTGTRTALLPWLLLLLACLALAAGWWAQGSRFAMPGGTRWQKGLGVAWSEGRGALCVARAPDSLRIALELRLPGVPQEIRAWPADGGSLSMWGDAWLAWIDSRAEQAYGLARDAEGWLCRIGDGARLIAPSAAPGPLVAVAGRGFARGSGAALELWQLQAGGWQPCWRRTFPSAIVQLEPSADGLQLRVRLQDGGELQVPVGFPPP